MSVFTTFIYIIFIICMNKVAPVPGHLFNLCLLSYFAFSDWAGKALIVS